MSTALENVTAPPRAAAVPAEKHTPIGERVQSIDVLRGFDMFWISGGENIVHPLANATAWTWAIAASHQLTHSQWAGVTCYDLIQPLFLFITGMTLPLAVGRRLANGASRWAILRRLLLRTLWLVLLGHLVKNGPVSLHFSELRYTSVLGRIGVASLAAGAIVMFARLRGQILWIVGILVTYWTLLTFVPAPGQSAPSHAQGVNIVDWLDQHIMPGKLRSGNHDDNGWSSTPPVIATVLLGALAGAWLVSARSTWLKSAGLAGAGLVLVALGWLWGLQSPIIKHIWTSSYVVYTAGWSCLLMSAFHAIIDGLQWRGWAFPFLLIGMNPLLIYFLRETKLVDFPYIANFLLGFAFFPGGPAMAPVWQAVAAVSIELVFLYWLYRRHLFWRV